MKFLQSKITSSNTKIHQNFNQILLNFPKLPLPKSQLLQIYDNYLQLNNDQQNGEELLVMVTKANDLAILKEFLAFMNQLFYDLDLEFNNINSPADITRIKHLIQSNFPSFVANQKSSNLPQKKTQASIIKPKFQVTPGGQQSKVFEAQQVKVDFIFSYLFEQIHFLVLRYKDYYQMQNVDSLQNAVCESFSSYVEQNQSLFFPQNLEIEQKQNLKLEDMNKMKEQSLEQKQENQKQNSQFVNNLIDVVIQNAQSANLIRKVQQGEANKRQQIKIQKYQVKPHNIMGKGFSFFQSIYKQGLTKTISSVLHYARDMSIKKAVKQETNQLQEEMVMKLADTILKSHIRHNVNLESGLQPDEFRLIEEFICQPKIKELEGLDEFFTQNQKQMVLEVMFSVIRNLEDSLSTNHFSKIVGQLKSFAEKFSNLKVKQLKSQSKVSSKKGIRTTLSKINTLSELPNTFYLIAILFRELESNYCPHTRRIMLKICHGLEQRSKQSNKQEGEYRKFCLVHALKLLQSHNIKRSQVCKIITNQKPFRQSHLPLKNQKIEYFEENDPNHYSCEQAQLHLQLQINRLHIFQHKKKYKDPAKLQLFKLSHSTNKKVITILVSGFLSEDTNKFEEWMGVLEPTYDSEIYALKWESKTIEHILEFTINACKDIALTGAGIGMIGGPYIKAALILKQILTKYHSNPFIPCFQMATITGIYFADLLINLFQGHFINLVGFSLGTQVVASALEQFKKRGKLHMINRFITLGGVADKLYLSQILDSVQQSEENPISISWTNVYCQTDNILRYLLRVSMPSIEPIGLMEIKQNEKGEIKKKNDKQENLDKGKQGKAKVYQVDSINVTEFVSGHLTYRSNMKNIARLLGIKDE